MKNTIKAISLAGVIGLAMSPFAGAAPEGDGEDKERRGPRRGPPPPEVLAEFDKDGDGKLNQEERQAARDAMKAKIDTDGDGEISEEERAAAREARRAKVLERFDEDGNGELDEDEKKAMREALRRRGGPGKGGPGKRGPGKGGPGKGGPKGPPADE